MASISVRCAGPAYRHAVKQFTFTISYVPFSRHCPKINMGLFYLKTLDGASEKDTVSVPSQRGQGPWRGLWPGHASRAL